MAGESGDVAHATMTIAAFVLCIIQWYIDAKFDGIGELVFDNLPVLAKSISCLKQFITAYHALHTKGSEVFSIMCFLGFFLQIFSITIHLNRKYKSWARTTIVVMATLMAAGFFFLCRGMLIPNDHAWNTTAVPAIIIFIVLFEAALLIRSQETENGGDQHLLRDLVMKLFEESISICRWVGSIAQTHDPLDAENILNLVGGGLPVLIGAYLIAWILYKMDIMCKVINWFRKIGQVSAGEEEQIAGSAMEVDEDGNVEKQVVEQEDVEVVVVAAAAAAATAAAAMATATAAAAAAAA